MSQATIEHITADEKGVARLIGRRTKVMQFAVDSLAGMSPAEIQAAYPYLSLSEIPAALAYHYDHQAEIDAEIREAAQAYEHGLTAQQSDPVFRARWPMH